MKRRDFLKAAGGVAVGALAAPTAALAHAAAAPALHTTRRIVLTCAYPTSAGGTFDAACRLASRLQGHLDAPTIIEVTASAEGSVDALMAGGAGMTFATESANIAQTPALAFVAGLPGNFAHHPQATQQWLSGAGELLWHRAHARTGLLPLYAGCEGHQPGLWSRDPIESFSGLKVAASQSLRSEVLAGLGARPVTLPPAAWASALARGNIDAVEVASLEDVLALGIARIATHCLEGALATYAAPLALTVSPSIWNALASNERAAIRAQVADHARTHDQKAAENHGALKRALSAAFGCVFRSPTRDETATVGRLSEAVIADCSSRDGACLALSGASVAAAIVQRKTDSRSTHRLNVV